MALSDIKFKMYKSKINELAEAGLTLQKERGGIDPHPDFIHGEGTITTSELLNSIVEYRDIIDFSKFIEEDRRGGGRYVSTKVEDGYDFLLDTQLKNGGFAPGGDISFAETDVDYNEATASSILALMKGIEGIDSFIDEDYREGRKKHFETRIGRALGRINELKVEEDDKLYWNSGEVEIEEDEETKRVPFDKKKSFVTIKIGEVFNNYLRNLENSSLEEELSYEDVLKDRNKIGELIVEQLRNGYLTNKILSPSDYKEIPVGEFEDEFTGSVNREKGEELSLEKRKFFSVKGEIIPLAKINFSNTASAIGFLYESLRIGDKFPFKKEEIDEITSLPYKVLKESTLKKDYPFSLTDGDAIKLDPLSKKLAPESDVIVRPQKLFAFLMEKSKKGRVFDDFYYKSRMKELYSELNNKRFCKVNYHGENRIYPLANAYAISALGEFTRQNKKVKNTVNDIFEE